jgi:ubiquinol-cytochrome c reductase cytochrome c1 subunit
VTDGPNDQGEMFQRPGRPSDPIPPPFPNDQTARSANNGALPPDLSLITKAREGGADYVYGILTGFKDAPAGMKMNPNMNYNEYFAGHQIAMPPPLNPDQIKYAEEPTLEARHRMGFKVILFLIVLTGLLYAAKRRIWSRIH